MSSLILKYAERVIVFLDILGFKEMVKQSENDQSKLETIYSALEYLKKWEVPEKWNLELIEIEESAQKKGLDKFEIKGKTNCTAFSDSIVISVQIENYNVNEVVSTLIANLALMGAVLMAKGILFRGGMSIGKIIHNDNGTVLGQGLIDAYKLEKESAKYPRIILSKKIINILEYPIFTKKRTYPYQQYLDRYHDGCVGFHQMKYFQVMQSWDKMTVDNLSIELKKIKNVIIDGLDSNFENADIFLKFEWLKEQYQKLVILDEGSIKNIKSKLYELNENIYPGNIHYSYTDKYYTDKKANNS